MRAYQKSEGQERWFGALGVCDARLIDFVERMTGKKLDKNGLSFPLDNWMKNSTLFAKAWRLRSCHPNPMPAKHMATLAFPNVHFRAYPEAVKLYQKVYDERHRLRRSRGGFLGVGRHPVPRHPARFLVVASTAPDARIQMGKRNCCSGYFVPKGGDR